MVIQIDIQRKLPVINGFVQIPDGEILLRNQLTLAVAEATIAGSDTIQISGNMRSDREWLVLPAFDKADGAPSDFFQELRDAV